MIATLAAIGRDVIAHKLCGRRKPLVLSISVTSRCNLRCSYCYSAEDNLNARDVSADEICQTMAAFYELGTRVIMLQGGEPLLHPEIDRIISFVKKKGMYCAVTTNGSFVPDHLESLKKVDQVQLSIDGNREVTDSNRGAGVYDGVVRAMDVCSLHQIPFHLHAVLTNRSTRENTLIPLLELADRYSADINFCFPNPTGAAEGKAVAMGGHLVEFYKMLLEEKKKNTKINNTRRGIADIIDWVAANPCGGYIRKDDNNSAAYPECVMGNLVCWLDSEGQLHPCAVRYGQDGFSHSIKDNGVKEAWQKLADKPCRYCANSTEFNQLFTLRGEAVLNSLRFLSRKTLSFSKSVEK
ncbi:MAG: radical SAM protein [Desulfuromonadaceae bacterium]|nr:radical SAM protein [Desulfuromonadaceae bacterium]MDD2856448.1 radical SAM protein [Desulfuromonadaceae bacterium]